MIWEATLVCFPNQKCQYLDSLISTTTWGEWEGAETDIIGVLITLIKERFHCLNLSSSTPPRLYLDYE